MLRQPVKPTTPLLNKTELVKKYLDKFGQDAKPRIVLKAIKKDYPQTEVTAPFISAVKTQLKKRRQPASPQPPVLVPNKRTISIDAIRAAKEFIVAAGGLANAKEIIVLLESIK